jgi:fatty-acyl-CoA synthase
MVRTSPARTIPRVVLHALRAAPHQTYSFHSATETETTTGGALANRIEATASALRSRPLRPRQVIPLFGASSPALWSAFMGAMAADLVPCILAAPTFKTHLPTWIRNLKTLLARYGIQSIVADREVGVRLSQALAGEGEGFSILPLEDLSSGGPAEVALPDDGSAVAFLQHSSGSTGTPKGVALRHDAVLSHLAAYAEAIDLRADDRVCSWLPLYHDMGLVTSFLLPLTTGVGCDTLRPQDWILDPARILSLMSAQGSTLAWWPNFTFNLLAARVRPADVAAFDLRRVRLVVNCSEPVLPSSHDRLLERMGPAGLRRDAIQTCYALAENVFAATQSRPPGPVVLSLAGGTLSLGQTVGECAPDHPGARRVMSSGSPIPTVEVRVVDEQRRPLSDGCVGEVALAGPSLFAGYQHLAEASQGVLDEGVYYTGDVGFLRAGELFVLGRRSDLIIVGGRNFQPGDIETLVGEVEGIKDGRVVAFGVLREEKGTEDVVVLAESEHHAQRAVVQALKKEIRSRVLQRLDCAVDVVAIVAPQALVKTSSGKIARRDNRAIYLDGLPKES